MSAFISKDAFNKTGERVLFRCSCSGGYGCDQFLEFRQDDGEYWLATIGKPANLWQVLKWWWHQRQVWSTDLYMTPEDVQSLKKALDNL